MIGSEYSRNIHMPFKISIGTEIRSPKMLKSLPHHCKTKKKCNHAVKKLPFIISYVPDQYKTQKKCDKAIVENVETLAFSWLLQ